MPAPETGSYIYYECQGYPVSHPTGPLFPFTSFTSCTPLGLTPPELARGPSRATQAFGNAALASQPCLNSSFTLSF